MFLAFGRFVSEASSAEEAAVGAVGAGWLDGAGDVPHVAVAEVAGAGGDEGAGRGAADGAAVA